MKNKNICLIPSVRIGVTGHRELDDADLINQRISDVIKRIYTLLSSNGINVKPNLHILSPLAEGTDRLVVNQAFEDYGNENVMLEAVLPMPPKEYEKDFDTDESIIEFNNLLISAAYIRVMVDQVCNEENRINSYEAAGKYVVVNSDFLIAIWDGEKGRGKAGTDDIITFAESTDQFIFWINAVTGEITEKPGDLDIKQLVQSLIQ